MKKLLGLLSVLTISGTAVPITVAVSSYEKLENNKANNLEKIIRNKRENESFDDYYYFVKQIQETNNHSVLFVTLKTENEIYLGTASGGAFVFNLNENKLIKIDGVPDVTVWSINFNKNNDTYFATQQGVYLLKSNEKVATKINGTEGDVRWITIDSNNICHFAMWQKGLFKWENNKLKK
ncbi:hypothetical protein [Spiroplasma endosymbiont of Polydrusus cervinus]|uniref:hypothetical protein n=1 Tax=Spiroplasma endosymbiont of Polydrusus cervinus TaxID=3066287 RepID=UPI0030CE6448